MANNNRNNRGMPMPPSADEGKMEDSEKAQDESPEVQTQDTPPAEEPQVSSKPPEPSSTKIVQPPKSGGIKVVALRAGYINSCRKVEGDHFEVPNMQKVGSWMKCVDPKLEAEHQRLMKEQKRLHLQDMNNK